MKKRKRGCPRRKDSLVTEGGPDLAAAGLGCIEARHAMISLVVLAR